MVTGYASLDSAIFAVRVGAFDYLTKPLSLGVLDVILTRIANRASLEKGNRDLVHTAALPLSSASAVAVTEARSVAKRPDTVAAVPALSLLEQVARRIEACLAPARRSTDVKLSARRHLARAIPGQSAT
jgi:DNA-binding NtrC family response regulator